MDASNPEAAFRSGDLDRATALCEQALRANPNDVVALRVRGMIEVRRRRPQQAIPYFRKALDASRNDFLTLEWLQGALLETARYKEAVEIGERALSLRPKDLNVQVALSHAYIKMGDPKKAIRLLESASSLEPTNAQIHRLLGAAYERAKLHREALAEYREAIALKPTFTEAYDRANRLLLEGGQFAEALKLAEQAPAYGPVQLQAAQALGGLGRLEEAIPHALKACELDPALVATVANWLQAHGRSTEARDMLERSIAQRPSQGRAYYGLIRARKATEEDRLLLAKLDKQSDIPPIERLALLRALGKASDDLGQFESAMRRFNEAAALARRVYGADVAFDSKKLDAARESLFRLVDQGLLSKYAHLGRPGPMPIFVIGMIRSGTTLVQQILTSHPEVGDAGELPYWTTAYPSIVNLDRSELREKAFVSARDEYLEVLRRFDPNSRFVSNKWPTNYAFAPLLRLAYPEAKIVHITRNPIDTALSIYTSDLGEPPPEFSCSKADIVAVYRDYQTRMNRWESIGMFTLRYEDLVADQELWTRRIIDHCGLPWNDRCLEFYAGDRLVNTPSMFQVRKPIYRSSVDRWRHYEPWLGEFATLRPR